MTTPFNPLDQLNSLVDAAVETQAVDMTETGTGGGEKIILPKGPYNCRMIEYIEYGKVVPTHQGKPTGRPAALNARVGFCFYGPNGEEVYIRSLKMPVSNHEKANAKKLFDRMNYTGTLKHLAQGLNQCFRMELDVQEKDGREYNTMKFETLSPLPKFDPETGSPITLPEFDTSKIQVFLWANPTKETWDSLYIDGTDDKGKSKNFIQEDILKAVDYEGSPLQALLEGGLPMPPADEPKAESAPTQADHAAAAQAAMPDAPAMPTMPDAPAV
ncbi:hypothetical protein vBVpPAC2_10 [Vibrio phage vB_VpP_AC2]|uniref:Fe-S oxidoreductase n=3 Tax=Maculvirus TaxID=2731958 RepID=A0A9E7NK24_9CAUD|nr:hypothetical protein VPP93_gp17 [Vibrio phage VP93]ACP44088.1 hypothetical protein VPP93_gp17 [Vibrio phage VP93]UPT53637.1 hypothetical protein [Vibrio phage F23s2]UTQ72384.1 hypothetical protein vBVpPAC2_10 [Vibrio phage vB_VpP_AC2]WJZ23417.1 Fe-S oxidoreductase [Vibrio phage VPy02]